MKHPILTIEQTESPEVTYGDYGATAPQGPGDWSYRTPATYAVTGPTGNLYTVAGSAAGWRQRREWWYSCLSGLNKGDFQTLTDCIAAIAKLESPTQ